MTISVPTEKGSRNENTSRNCNLPGGAVRDSGAADVHGQQHGVPGGGKNNIKYKEENGT